jgi:hypothetical protein
MSDKDVLDKYFTIRDVGPGLDGLDVKVSHLTPFGTAEVCVIRKNGSLIGDRPWQEAVAPGTLHISKKCLFLSPFQDEMEFSSKNDYGKLVSENSSTRGSIKVIYSEFENALSVNVYDVSVEPNKTLFSRVFFGDKLKTAAKTALLSFSLPAKEPSTVVFDLRKIQ